jgi:hypothetical protein
MYEHLSATKSNAAGFCRLESPGELACQALGCDFARDGLCRFKSVFLAAGDVPFVHRAAIAGDGSEDNAESGQGET